MNAGYPLLIFAAVVFTVVLAVFGVGLTWRRDRSRRGRLGEWALGQGLRLTSLRMLSRYSIPTDLRGQETLSALFYKIKAAPADGRTVTGYVRIPMFEGRFAPPIRVIWEPAGPDLGVGFDEARS